MKYMLVKGRQKYSHECDIMDEIQFYLPSLLCSAFWKRTVDSLRITGTTATPLWLCCWSQMKGRGGPSFPGNCTGDWDSSSVWCALGLGRCQQWTTISSVYSWTGRTGKNREHPEVTAGSEAEEKRGKEWEKIKCFLSGFLFCYNLLLRPFPRMRIPVLYFGIVH